MTLWEVPSENFEVRIYYFNQETPRRENGIAEMVADRLTRLGMYDEGIEVVLIDPEMVPSRFWNDLLEALQIKSVPAILVSESDIGLKDLDLSGDLIQKLDNNSILAKIERDSRMNNIPQRHEDVRAFVDGILETARLEEISSTDELINETENIHGTSEYTSESDVNWNTLHMLGLCFEIAMYKIDEFITDNGLQKSVDEIKKRRWAVRLALTLYLLWYYMTHP